MRRLFFVCLLILFVCMHHLIPWQVTKEVSHPFTSKVLTYIHHILSRTAIKDAAPIPWTLIPVTGLRYILVCHWPANRATARLDFLNFNQEFLLVGPILTLCCTYFWRALVTCVAWKSRRACRHEHVRSIVLQISLYFRIGHVTLFRTII